ncbi:YfhE family protein [Sporosarcina sp. CAU 1771]
MHSHDFRLIGKPNGCINTERSLQYMHKKKEPHKQMTEKNNNLTSTQEVLYQEVFNKADKINNVKRKT